MSNSTKSDGRFKPKLSPEQASEMVAAYVAGESAEVLSPKFGVTYESVLNYVRRSGQPPRSNRVFSKMTDEQRACVVADYQTGLNAEELAAKYGGKVSSVLRFLRRAGTTMRTQSEACRQYAFDPLAFETPSPERSYFFGMLLADGCITRVKNSRHVILVLTESDRHLLEDLKAYLKSEHPVLIAKAGRNFLNGHWLKSRPSARFYISSNVLADSLERLGLFERKSKIAVMPSWCSQDADAWRGYVDGDGWVLVQKNRIRPIIGLCGSHRICEQFSEFGIATGVGSCSVLPNSSIWSAQYVGRKATAMIRALYARPGSSLRRKQITAHAVLASYWGDESCWRKTRVPKSFVIKRC